VNFAHVVLEINSVAGIETITINF